jgi:hypothetical protein
MDGTRTPAQNPQEPKAENGCENTTATGSPLAPQPPVVLCEQLTKIVAAWPCLSQHFRNAIMAIVADKDSDRETMTDVDRG